MRDDGSGNFSETTDLFGVSGSENGYWFAENLIDFCNSNLTNQTMTQQLSYSPIPVEDINYGYKLSGVFFNRNTTYFNYPELYFSLYENYDEVINIFIYPYNIGRGASDGGAACWMGGAEHANSLYQQYGYWGIDQLAPSINHEVGHCLSLDHCKRTNNGYCCINNSNTCLDDCNDTPTYLELINDGYSNPCVWNSPGYSNNIMDYSPLSVAFTPCQIAQVHSYIENVMSNFQYGNFNSSSVQITSFSDNKAYIANSVVIPSGADVFIPNNKKLYIEAQELEINGSFEVPLGSTFEFFPYGL